MYAIRIVGPSGFERYANGDCTQAVSVLEMARTFSNREVCEVRADAVEPLWRTQGYIIDVVNLEGE